MAALGVLAGCGRPQTRLVLWAWERPEHLGFIDPSNTAVAYLDRTILVSEGTVEVRRRAHALEAPRGAEVIAVARIESRGALPDGNAGVLAPLLEMARRSGIRGVQIDFDARASERAFYAALLKDLRASMPRDLPLTITALASWCAGDRWLDGLPIDEAVPQLFRMGPEAAAVIARAARFRGVCGSSVGFATDEPFRIRASRRRVWLFHPRAWTREAYDAARRRL